MLGKGADSLYHFNTLKSFAKKNIFFSSYPYVLASKNRNKHDKEMKYTRLSKTEDIRSCNCSFILGGGVNHPL